jgi:predicted 3-demethylubiquinone-9 3-methyltransferase (glyoxalase superfamily)
MGSHKNAPLTPAGRAILVRRVGRHGPGAPMPEGTVLGVTFVLDGTEFRALNGGPHFKFTEASSMFVRCDTRDEIDRLWPRLTEGGGAEVQCGWLKDRYGLSWQIVPTALNELLSDPDRARAAGPDRYRRANAFTRHRPA